MTYTIEEPSSEAGASFGGGHYKVIDNDDGMLVLPLHSTREAAEAHVEQLESEEGGFVDAKTRKITPHEGEREEAAVELAEASAEAAAEHAEEALEAAAEIEEVIGEAEAAIPADADPEARAAVIKILESLADAAEEQAELAVEMAEVAEDAAEAAADADTVEEAQQEAEIAEVAEDLGESAAEAVTDPESVHPWYRDWSIG